MRLDDLRGATNALAPHYSRFRVGERLLLTGHFHQAWPDVAREGQLAAWDDAALHVDDKWARAVSVAQRVARGLARRIDDPWAEVAIAAATHDLVVKLLSALPLRRRPVVLTTDGEYHSARRQLDRLAEEGLEIRRLPALPVESLAERLAAAVDDRTALVLVSAVMYRTAAIVPGLAALARACQACGAELLVDAYHAVNVTEFSVRDLGLEQAYVTGGGYKYLQWGEGVGWLRLPEACTLRPAITGWFAEFNLMTGTKAPGEVPYGVGAWRFAGATYDPTSTYRAERVLDFMEGHGLDVPLLRQVSQHQVGLLARTFDELDLDPSLVTRDRSRPLAGTAGFLALTSPRAAALDRGLRERGVLTDHRDTTLRLGPAPYLRDDQLSDAMVALGEVARSLRA